MAPELDVSTRDTADLGVTASQDADSRKPTLKDTVKGEKKEDDLLPGDQLPASSSTDGRSPQPTSKKSSSLSTTSSDFFNPAATHQSAETTLQTSSDKPPYEETKNRENLRKKRESISDEDTSDEPLDGEESTTSKEERKPIKKTSTMGTGRVSSLDTFQHRRPRKINRTGSYQPKGTKKMRTPAEQKALEKKNNKTGELGEQIVFTHLEKKYRRDYELQGYQYCETSQGFTLQQESKDYSHLIKIIWLNGKHTEKNGMVYEESGKPADFKIIDIKKDNKTGETKEKKLYIEVKATEKNKPAALNYSKNEWYRMFKYMPEESSTVDTTTRAVDYHLYRVYDVYKEWSIKIMENPGKKILQSTQEQNLGDNKFIVENVQFKL